MMEFNMITWACWNCGCTMAMTEEHNNMLRANHHTFYCLNGHANVYTKKTELEDVQEQLAGEVVKNIQLESIIKQLNKPSFFTKIKDKFKWRKKEQV